MQVKPLEFKWEERILTALALLLLAHACYAWSIGFTNSVSDQYGFRQAQTAIAVQSMLDGGPWLAYYTPVFGPPWSLPFEFPLFQWITAILADEGMPLIEAGRAVSILFFLATLAGCWKVLGELEIEKVGKLAVVAFLLASPIYLFWTRTFLIETCALALSVWYLLFAIKAMKSGRLRDLISCALLGMLAAAVKITTFLPLLIIVGIWLAAEFFRRKMAPRAAVILGSFEVALPAITGLAWTEYAGRVDRQNILVASFLTQRYLKVWVFGKLADRFSPVLWTAFFSRIVPDSAGLLLALLIVVLLLPLAGRHARYAVISFALFLLAILIFPTLHTIHSYYQTGNACFLSAGCALALSGLITGQGLRRIAGWALLLFMLGGGLVRYYNVYAASARGNDLRPVQTGKEVQRLTVPGDVIVIRGADWSSEIPFYAHRRAIMDGPYAPDLIRRQLKAISPSRVGGVLFCDKSRVEFGAGNVDSAVQKINQMYGVDMSRMTDDGFCLQFTRQSYGK